MRLAAVRNLDGLPTRSWWTPWRVPPVQCGKKIPAIRRRNRTEQAPNETNPAIPAASPKMAEHLLQTAIFRDVNGPTRPVTPQHRVGAQLDGTSTPKAGHHQSSPMIYFTREKRKKGRKDSPHRGRGVMVSSACIETGRPPSCSTPLEEVTRESPYQNTLPCAILGSPASAALFR